jgi:hypothetical protein
MARYVFSTIAQILFTYLLAVPFAPVIALFCKSDGYLPNWLCWFQTEDASLDAGWRDGYFQPVGAPAPIGWERWWLRTRWLWRNPAYGLCYWPLGLPYNPSDWVIDVLVHDGPTLTELKAHTSDGKYFCQTNSSGLKLGYKLWWALDENWKLIDNLPSSRGPDNRLPICFTPKFTSM